MRDKYKKQSQWIVNIARSRTGHYNLQVELLSISPKRVDEWMDRWMIVMIVVRHGKPK